MSVSSVANISSEGKKADPSSSLVSVLGSNRQHGRVTYNELDVRRASTGRRCRTFVSKSQLSCSERPSSEISRRWTEYISTAYLDRRPITAATPSICRVLSATSWVLFPLRPCLAFFHSSTALLISNAPHPIQHLLCFPDLNLQVLLLSDWLCPSHFLLLFTVTQGCCCDCHFGRAKHFLRERVFQRCHSSCCVARPYTFTFSYLVTEASFIWQSKP